MIDAAEIVGWWDRYLKLGEIEDYPGALNGLQVEATRPIRRIGAATDACQATIDLATSDGCELLLVHHGLFWGGVRPLTGATFRRVSTLITSGTGLYSAHLPLDVHEEVGNNVLLAEALDLAVEGRFGSYGSLSGLGVLVQPERSRDGLIDLVAGACGGRVALVPGGPEHVESLAIATGGAASLMAEAAAAGADTFLTGEGNHHTYHEAMELGINVLYAGHYATETFGVRKLAASTAERFGVEHRFYDVPTGL